MSDKVLVVDDEPDIYNAAKIILERRGYQVVTASNGDEALKKAETEIPDLILLDVLLDPKPGKNGLDVCRILKSQEKTKSIPVVMFTVLSRDIDKRLTRESGADGHFTKPFTPEGLLKEVERQLDISKYIKNVSAEDNPSQN